MSAADAAVLDGVGAQISAGLAQMKVAAGAMGGAQDPAVASGSGMLIGAADMLEQAFNQLIASVKKVVEAAP